MDRAAAGDDEGRLRSERIEDFDAFCRFVADDCAYFDLKKAEPRERLSHVDGTPREAFVSCALVADDDAGELAQAAGIARSLLASEAAYRCSMP